MVQGLEFVGGAGFLFHGYQPGSHPSLLAQDMFHRLWNTMARHCKTTRVLGRVCPEASSLSLEVPLAGLQMSPTDRWVSRRVCVWLCTTWLLYSFTVILSSQLKSFFLPVALWGSQLSLAEKSLCGHPAVSSGLTMTQNNDDFNSASYRIHYPRCSYIIFE